MKNSRALVLGTNSALSKAKPARVKNAITKTSFASLPSSSNTGGCFQLNANTGPIYPGLKDTVGVKGTGFKLSDYVDPTFYNKYDYFRIMAVEYIGTLSNIPKQSVPNVHIYSSIDWDDASVASFTQLINRPNVAVTNLTATAPTQAIVKFAPRRRISGNVDPSLQVVTPTREWCDIAYASSFIFGNVKLGILCPDGQVQYTVSDQCSVLFTSRIWVEFKGRID